MYSDFAALYLDNLFLDKLIALQMQKILPRSFDCRRENRIKDLFPLFDSSSNSTQILINIALNDSGA